MANLKAHLDEIQSNADSTVDCNNTQIENFLFFCKKQPSTASNEGLLCLACTGPDKCPRQIP